MRFSSQFFTLGPQSRLFALNPSAPSSISSPNLRPRGLHFLWVERVSETRDIALERSRSTLSSPYSRAANRDDFDRMQRIMDRHDHSILLRLRNGTTSHVHALSLSRYLRRPANAASTRRILTWWPAARSSVSEQPASPMAMIVMVHHLSIVSYRHGRKKEEERVAMLIFTVQLR